jgi:hypothetical protein
MMAGRPHATGVGATSAEASAPPRPATVVEADCDTVTRPPEQPPGDATGRRPQPEVLAAGNRFHRQVQAAFVAGLLGLDPSGVLEQTLPWTSGPRQRADILLLAPDNQRSRIIVEIKSTSGGPAAAVRRRALLLRHLRQLDGYLDVLLEDLGTTVDGCVAASAPRQTSGPEVPSVT